MKNLEGAWYIFLMFVNKVRNHTLFGMVIEQKTKSIWTKVKVPKTKGVYYDRKQNKHGTRKRNINKG